METGEREGLSGAQEQAEVRLALAQCPSGVAEPIVLQGDGILQGWGWL